MTTNSYEQTKTALLTLGGQRVWSLMVTLFGDLAQSEGQAIDGPALSAIMGGIDVRPEAVRVALHRLRNDGWIMSARHGRTGRHTLTPTSRAESLQASARIYARPNAPETGWQVILLEDAQSDTRDDMARRGFVAISPRVYLGSSCAHAPAGAMILAGASAPDWLRQQIAGQMLGEDYTKLAQILDTAADTLTASTLNPVQTAILRCLIVHNWRRIVLRHPPIPRALLPADWAGHHCHLLVDQLLIRFPRPQIACIAVG